MMKRFICMLLCAFALCTGVCRADIDGQYTPAAAVPGDADFDGEVNAKDVLLLRKYIAGFSEIRLNFEHSDVFSDGSLNAKDVLSLRRSIAGIGGLTEYKIFARADEDITERLEDLGIPGAESWPDSGGVENIIARNPYDMLSIEDRVFFSGGNYDTNKGPVNMQCVTRDSKFVRFSTTLNTEQINRMYMYSGNMYATAIDPQAWGVGEFYLYRYRNNRWLSYPKLGGNIHCYDMVKHNDNLFFAGSSISGEDSVGSVHRVSFSLATTGTGSDYVQVPFIGTDGKAAEPTQYGVPRVYELMEFNGVLYAHYYDQYALSPTSLAPKRNGIYKYNDQTGVFEYVPRLNIDLPFSGSQANQDGEKIQQDFQWGSRYVFINNGLFLTEDMISHTQKKIPGFADYIIRDSVVVNDRLYLLGGIEKSDGGWTNAVFETTDFNDFRRILHFDTPTFTRSFEYCDGAFFFGLGTYKNEADTQAGKNCGRLYRYIYYN